MRPNALTVDVEEYFQIESLANAVRRDEWDRLESRVVPSTERLLALFAARGVKATFFTLGWVARRYPKLVKRIVAEGHELASHGDGHRMITQMTPDEFRADLRASKRALEDAGGVRVLGYRAPTFSITDQTRWALDVLAEEGFAYDSSIYPIHHDRYGIPDAPRAPHRIALSAGKSLAELPMTTVRIAGRNLPAGGGGYLRLLPLAYNLRALDRAASEGPFVVYLHPWEIDPHQPRFALPTLSRLRTYAGLDTMETRLGALLDRYAFAPASEVLRACGVLDASASKGLADAPAASV